MDSHDKLCPCQPKETVVMVRGLSGIWESLRNTGSKQPEMPANILTKNHPPLE